MPKKKDEDEIDIDALLSEKKKTKRELSEEQKNVLRERLVEMRAKAKAKREAKKAELVKDPNISNEVFERQYKDKFEMINEKLTNISTDVSDMKKAKMEKARLKAEAKALAEAEKEKIKEEPMKQETPKQEPAKIETPTPKPTLTTEVQMPEVKLSFRQRFKGSIY